ncbi:hypothetical protein [Chryseobacterium foetidum]|uniref:hypothetical protein n=1 Tax=Chryseobacterium foetidum TaxID=2951057 RepID=UPI0021C6D060|nr:hypothetical protein [Chryseobacterium foetidum]
MQVYHRKNQDTYNLKFTSADINTSYSDDFGVKKTAHGFNIIIGNQISVSKKLVLEPFIGIGSLNIKTRNIDLEYDETKHVIEIDGLSLINSRLESNTGNFTNFVGVSELVTDCRKREDGRWVREVYIMPDIDSSIHL